VGNTSSIVWDLFFPAQLDFKYGRQANILENQLSPITPELMSRFSTCLFDMFDQAQQPPYGSPTRWGALTKGAPGQKNTLPNI
jgi:hypothetical protein